LSHQDEVARAVLDMSHRSPKELTAERLLRRLGCDKEVAFAELDAFVAELNSVSRECCKAIQAESEDLMGRLPSTACNEFGQNLRVFVSEELVRHPMNSAGCCGDR
jgi:hypothetical protein